MYREPTICKANRLSILASPGFLIGLILLLLNDYFFKQYFPGIVTGKLSDFAGLFVVGLIINHVYPGKSGIPLAVLGLMFTFWKSSYSESIIATWNSVGLFVVGRTVDYTDLVALSIIPLTIWYSRTYRPLKVRSILLFPIFIMAVIGIMGTSPARYGVRMDIPEKQIQKSEKDGIVIRDVPTLGIIHDYALTNDFTCGNCSHQTYHKIYRGNETVIEVNYDPDLNKVYLGISTDAYRKSYEEQQMVVEATKDAINNALARHSYSMEKPEAYSFLYPNYKSTLRIKSPTKGLPFSSKYNGEGNEDIMRSYSYINEHLSSQGFKRANSEYCIGSNDSDFSNEMCRVYKAGRTIGAGVESVSTTITLSAYVDWFGTYLYVDFQKNVEDKSVNLDTLITEVRNELLLRLEKRADITFDVHQRPENMK